MSLSTEKPILFNTEMVKAILDGRKTQTRRVTFHQDKESMEYLLRVQKNKPNKVINGQYNKGDVLYVRETWSSDCKSLSKDFNNKFIPKSDDIVYYKADNIFNLNGKWKPSIHMPKKYARIFLKVTNVRVERLQDIDNDGIFAEGFKPYSKNILLESLKNKTLSKLNDDVKDWWINLWNSTAKDGYKWEDNPFVFVYEFERLTNG